MNPFDSTNNAFQQSLGNYKAGASSIAQGKIQANEALTGGKQQLMRSGISAKEQIGTSQVQSKIAEGSQKLMKELGIDLSFKPSLAGIKAISDYGGKAAQGWSARFNKENNPGLTTENPTDITSELGQSNVAFDVGSPLPNPLDEISDEDAASLFRPVGAPATVTASPIVRAPPGADEARDFLSKPEGSLGTKDNPLMADQGGARPAGAPEEVVAQPIRPAGAPEEVVAQPLRGPAPDIGLPQGGEAAAANMAKTDAPASQTESVMQDFNRPIDGVIGDGVNRRAGQIGEESSTITRNDTSLTSEASGLADTATAEVSTLTSQFVEGAGSALSSIGGAIGDVIPIVGPILAGIGLFEGFHKLNKPYGDAGPDPYASVRASLATGQSKLNNLGTQISADQFATKVGQNAPAFGSLAAPTFNTSQQTMGATGHF